MYSNTGGFERAANWFYDFIDVNSNVSRAERVARQVDNGFTSLVNAAVMLVLFAVSLALAWYFDFESTFDGLEALREVVIPALPEATVHLASFLIIAITVTPTFLELFASGYAKANVAIIKMAVLGFSAFDVITDIPRAKAFIDSFQHHFDLLGPLIGWVAHWLVFFGFLLFATVGFQLAAVLFAFLTVMFIRKATGDNPRNPAPKNMGGGNNQPKGNQGPTPTVTIIDK